MKIPGPKIRMLSVTTKTQKSREGRKFRQYLASLAATIGPFAVGTVLAWTSPVLPKLQNENTAAPGPLITAEEGSWIGSIIAIGAIFGSLPASQGADYIGRKPMITLLAVPFVLSWILITVAETTNMLLVARFIAGAVIGAITGTIPMYIGEIAEVSIRGELGSYIQLMVTLGILFVYLISPFVNYFMLNVLCGIIPALFGLLFWLVAPESPLYLMRQNRRNDAEESLRILRGSHYDIHGELDEIQQQINNEYNKKHSYRVLFTNRAVVHATIAVMGLLSFLSFSGINVVIFHAEKIFEASNTNINSQVSAIVIGLMQVIMTYFSGLLVDRAGRRILLLVSDAIMAICLFALGLFFWAREQDYDTQEFLWLPLVSLSIYISVFSLGFGPIPGIMMGELFSPETKGVAIGVVCILASLLEFFVVKGFDNLLEWFQFGVTFWIFAVNCLLGTVFVYYLVPETKNKSMQQIQDELSGKCKASRKKRTNKNNTIANGIISVTAPVTNSQTTAATCPA